MSLTDISHSEQKIAERINSSVTGELAVSNAAGGLEFVNMSQAMEFAKMMSISSIAVPKHLRSNPGACLAIVIQAIEWKMSPYAVANKSYSVNDRLAYESQLVQAVILQRAPIVGRFKVEYTGEGDNRVCKVWARLKGSEDTVGYESPPFGKIQPKNSPLWKSDPDQQQFYYSGRALCRRHFPDVLLGVYAVDEMLPPGPNGARDVTPAKTMDAKLDALAGIPDHVDPETGEVSNSAAADSLPSPTTAPEAGPVPPGPATLSLNDAGQAVQIGDTVITRAPRSTQIEVHPAASGQAAASGPPSEVAATVLPKNDTEYRVFAESWINEATDDVEIASRWKSEMQMRRKVNIAQETFEFLENLKNRKIEEIRDANRD